MQLRSSFWLMHLILILNLYLYTYRFICIDIYVGAIAPMRMSHTVCHNGWGPPEAHMINCTLSLTTIPHECHRSHWLYTGPNEADHLIEFFIFYWCTLKSFYLRATDSVFRSSNGLKFYICAVIWIFWCPTSPMIFGALCGSPGLSFFDGLPCEASAQEQGPYLYTILVAITKVMLPLRDICGAHFSAPLSGCDF